MKTRLAHWFTELSRPKKIGILIATDVLFSVLALWLAFSLRWGVWYAPRGEEWYLFVAAPFIAVPIFIRLGLYRAIVRYIEMRALWTIFQATTLYALVFAFVIYQSSIPVIPRTVAPLNGLLMMLLVGSSRFFARWWLSDNYSSLSGTRNTALCSKKNVIIYGAGSAGIQLAAALTHGREYNPVAFIDDNHLLHKQKINGVKIYSLSLLAYVIKRYQISDILLAMPSVSRSRRSEIIRLLEPYAVHVRSMPGLADIAQGKVTFDTLQEVDIADLLGRYCIDPDPSLIQSTINGKVVMVTGAGGSIGSELCRQIIRLQPTSLILFEICEFALYTIEKELQHLLSKMAGSTTFELVAVLGSVLDFERVEKICQTFKVQTFYHTASYKHVPIVERNPGEAVWNNIFGTLHTAQAAIAAQVEKFVLISTDKAVRPTNTMGATKRFAELILQALSVNQEDTQQTCFTMVRFGNVLDSSGSVVPLFREQIARGGPVTVTDPRVIRYFMTIPEAAQLVIQAAAMGQGGDVFVLDMGEPIRILDLAKRMIHLSGLEVKNEDHPDGEIEISFIGLRPGEKLFEELLIGDHVSETSHPRIMRAKEPVISWAELQIMLKHLKAATENDDYVQIRSILTSAVAGFVPQCGISDVLWEKNLRKD
ncbi:MAG: nucleoside-diphosphate sugar epimerase/dehydratase [Methylovulum sp.]|uniref:polysaccharide biosynthesis protein n=1 Tax=Methylovulum sp. TaxID=1916980 RepID=UPI0026251520|nr:nucleoside-diphosphate sugar epimerase/dehydratase [Methylovulum sp.]MDD2723481.1 nucleoside-diphosphate sugar epimerase/dehydratase [Methylovulum sp.]MDD5126465.1 nucleoside-diphosphate sugar epimerase/dehydratase [Methylovulum sp.]